mmetsp:Transcript_3013/g.7021  ORF Transcript_3013/g.7021 Transcript_3013/m.7021 type:complete len:279 (+) Transcript_3013:605-1441(+)
MQACFHFPIDPKYEHPDREPAGKYNQWESHHDSEHHCPASKQHQHVERGAGPDVGHVILENVRTGLRSPLQIPRSPHEGVDCEADPNSPPRYLAHPGGARASKLLIDREHVRLASVREDHNWERQEGSLQAVRASEQSEGLKGPVNATFKEGVSGVGAGSKNKKEDRNDAEEACEAEVIHTVDEGEREHDEEEESADNLTIPHSKQLVDFGHFKNIPDGNDIGDSATKAKDYHTDFHNDPHPLAHQLDGEVLVRACHCHVSSLNQQANGEIRCRSSDP